MNNENSTTNAILVILLVIVVGFIVWFAMGRRDNVDNTPNSTIEVNIPGVGGDGSGNTDTSPAQ